MDAARGGFSWLNTFKHVIVRSKRQKFSIAFYSPGVGLRLVWGARNPVTTPVARCAAAAHEA
jgi:hypothetical protein